MPEAPAGQQTTAAQASRNGHRLTATPLAEIIMRSIRWFEKPLWQRGAFQLLAGTKGAGKGTYLASLAARLTNAGHNVVFIASEDSAAIDLKPRLIAAGADIDHCYVIEQHVKLPEDIGRVREIAAEIGNVGLLVIDPVANHIGGKSTDSEGDVRQAIAPLNRLADELDCLLIGVRHPGKDRTRGAVASILGSTAWVDVPRSVVMIAVDDEDPLVRHIQCIAGNRSLNGAGQSFRIETAPVDGLEEPVTRVVEIGESRKNVDDLLGVRLGGVGSTSGQAREAILDILETEGDQESDALDARVAQLADLSARTIRNIRKKLRDEGLIRAAPDKDEHGNVRRWLTCRTAAPRD
jgi:hypothetical protein